MSGQDASAGGGEEKTDTDGDLALESESTTESVDKAPAEENVESEGNIASSEQLPKEAWTSQGEEERGSGGKKFWSRFAKGLLVFVLLFVILILGLNQAFNHGSEGSGLVPTRRIILRSSIDRRSMRT